MSSKNKIVFTIAFIFLLLISGIVSAQEDFMAFSQKQTIPSCGCSTTVDIITIKNTGLLVSTYAISLKGSAAKFSLVAPAVFSLQPGETTNLYTYITPPCNVRGDYDLFIYIETSSGAKKVLEQKVSVRNCQNINLVAKTYSQNTFQCTPTTFEFKIENIGGYTETYTLNVEDSIAKYVTFSVNSVVLAPKDSANVFMTVTMPCDVFGQKNILLKVKAEKSKYIAQIPFRLNIVLRYDFDLVPGDYIGSTFVPHQESIPYNLCEGEKKNIPIKILRNKVSGMPEMPLAFLSIINKDVANTYDINLIGPEWAVLTANRISIAKEGIFNVNVAPVSKGLFNLTFNVTAQKGMVNKKKSVYVNSETCYAPKVVVQTKKIMVNYSETVTEISIKNIGAKQAKYVLGLEAPEWITLEPSTLTLNPGETKNVLLKTRPTGQIAEGNYDALLKIIVSKTGQVYYTTFTVKLREKYLLEEYMKFGTYLLISLIILVIIITYLIKLPKKEIPKEVKKIEKKAEKVIPKKPEIKKIKEKPKKEARKLKTIKKYIISAIIILALITIILVSSLTDIIPTFINATKINITVQPEIEIRPEEKPEIKQINVSEINISKLIEPTKEFLSFYKYYILSAIILLIIILIIAQLAKRPKKPKPEVKVKKIEKKVEKVPKVKPEAKEIKEPRKLKWLWFIAIIILAGIAYVIYRYYDRLLVTIEKYPFIETIVNAALFYKYYVLAGVIILILLIIILSLKKKKEEEIKEEKIEEKINYLSYLFGLIIFTIIIAVIYFLIKYVVIPYWAYIIIGIAFLIFILILIAILNKIKTKRDFEKVWQETSPNIDIELKIDNKKIGFGELILRTKTKLSNVRIGFKKLLKRPTFLRASEKVYEYFEINKENIKNSDVRKGIIRFRVKKSWLDKNNIDPEQIILKNYTNRWINLDTKIIDSNRKYVYYEAEINRLSYFAIAAKTIKKEEKQPKRWPWVILLVVLVLSGLYYYYSVTQPIEIPQLEREPILKKEFSTQLWDEDTTLTIDLSEYFDDPDTEDKGKLIFTSTKPTNIDVVIRGSIVTLTPKQNWYGTEYIVFTADDGKGGIISSPKVTLTVRDVSEQVIFKKIQDWFVNIGFSVKNYFSGNWSYLIYGLIALVVIFLIIKYNRAIISFFLEEEKEERVKKK